MFGSDVLDIGVGITLLFLITSLICSAVNEIMEAVLKARASQIETGLRELLSDPKGEFLKLIYRHPLIYALYRGEYDPTKIQGGRWIRGATRNLPTYIPAASFARALVDIAVRGDPDTKPNGAPPLTLDSLRLAVRDLPGAQLQRAMLNAIDEGEGDLAKVQASLETWFDTCMDRVSGWYKRRSTVILFWLGLGVAVVLNVDPITIAQRLSGDATLRQRFVAEAQQFKPPPDCNAAAASTLRACEQDHVEALQQDLDALGAPVGWDGLCPAPQKQLGLCKDDGTTFAGVPMPDIPLLSALRIAGGWLMTAFAVTLGAPFWFDVLNRFMIVRSTIKPAQKSGEEGPAEPQAKPNAGASPPPTPGASSGGGAGLHAGASGGGSLRTGAASPSTLPPEDEDLDAPAPPTSVYPGDAIARAAADAEELH